MNIQFDEKNRVFKLDTEHTSYVMAVVDNEGFLGHVYYGAKISDTDVAYLLRTDENPMVPSKNNRDRSSFLDTFPMEYPGNGVGDYRESVIAVLDKKENPGTAGFLCKRDGMSDVRDRDRRSGAWSGSSACIHCFCRERRDHQKCACDKP